MARADTDSVTEGADTSGNVLTGVGTTSGAAGVDTAGADGFGLPQVVGVAAGNNTSSPVSGGVGTVSGIAGSYGTLYLNADGTYTYDANPNAVTSNQTDTFIYTVQDGDGDLSTTTLTINVNNVSVTASDTEALVNEAGLPRAAATPGCSEAFNGAITRPAARVLTPTLTSNGNGTYGNLVLERRWYLHLHARHDLPWRYQPTTVSPPSRMLRASTTRLPIINGNTTTGTINVSIIDDVPMARADTDTA